jgi:glycosyltransferase involved in cell wall biosynthesis
MAYAKFIRLYKDVVWKASTADEALQVSSLKTKEGKIFVAPDLPPREIFASYSQSMKPKKEAGKAKLVFLSRFVRGKNFNWILPVLEQVKGEIELDVIGPIEDREYWNEALRVIGGLPERIKVKSIGPIPHEQVSEAIVHYHFFLNPTLGENFGHIFLEALASGCPLIISDRTPWTDLEQHGSGWDMPREKPAKWVDVLNKCVEMDDHEYSKLSVNAKQHANNWLDAPGLSDTSEEVLEYALGR